MVEGLLVFSGAEFVILFDRRKHEILSTVELIADNRAFLCREVCPYLVHPSCDRLAIQQRMPTEGFGRIQNGGCPFPFLLIDEHFFVGRDMKREVNFLVVEMMNAGDEG